MRACQTRPWEAPETILSDAGVELGENYPFPVVTVEESEKALALAAEVIIKSVVAGNGPGDLKVPAGEVACFGSHVRQRGDPAEGCCSHTCTPLISK